MASKEDVSEIQKTMVSKTDLQKFEASIMKNTKVQISEAVDPLKADMCDMKERVQKAEEKWNTDALSLELRMGNIEKNPGVSSSSETVQPTKVVKDLQSMVNKLDPALRRASFIGWPTNVSAEKRMELMCGFMDTKYKKVRFVDCGHDYTGPYNDRKLSKTSWVEFSNTDTTKAFLKTVASDNAEITVDGSSVKVKPARTQIQKKRNYGLIRASELIKASGEGAGKNVKIEFKVPDSKERHVTVDGAVGFCQNQNDTIGVFRAPFQALSIE